MNDQGKRAIWKAKQLKLKCKEDFTKMVWDKWKEKPCMVSSLTTMIRAMLM